MNPVPPQELVQAARLQALKDTMACVSAGVVIVTAHHDGHDWGMTCSSFTTVSLDPALVLWCLHRGSSSHAAFTRPAAQGGGYCVNVLAPEQAALARRFASGTQAERFDGIGIERLASGRARLAGALAWFDCGLHEVLRAGDHEILIGSIGEFGAPGAAGAASGASSLVYAQRRFGHVTPQG
ncbi:flavin reductase family protein [Leptothrix discophora]|uniref:Flavin reductase family protein n=1 Tax=Leptothrix discophora TaxID=89 RepID=A0ABT9G826_LEPDI|nr:flavin reductase family protein [Leptothrix discophora]MDP4302631.1 flavin reductase family protein [Leptothrix discophora]